MPKLADPLIADQCLRAYQVHGSITKAASELGLPVHSVRANIHRAQGKCTCGRVSKSGFSTCSACLVRSARSTKQRHEQRMRNSSCRECGGPLAETSKRFCDKHLASLRQNQHRLRQTRKTNGICQFCTEPAVDAVFCATHRLYARKAGIAHRSRMKFGGLLEKVLRRDKRRCQICRQRPKRVEVHHIKGRANTMTNLVTLCAYCHKVLTFLEHCPNPQAAYNFYLSH